MKIRITSIVLSILVLFAFVPQISFGTVEEEGTITGFVEMNNSSFYFEGDPDEDELTDGLPDAIGVFLDGSQEPELIPVTWESVEDYDNSNFYFYSLKPVWEGYTLSEDLNEIFDVPWITVYKQEPENDSIEPMYSEEDIDSIYTEEEGSNDVGDEVYDDSIDLSLLDGTSLLDAFAEESYAATSTTDVVYNFLTKDMGLNMAATCAVMTNIYAESAMSSINLQNTYNKSLNLSDTEYTRLVDKSSDGKYKSGKNFKTDEAGYGLCQWTSSGRKTSLFNRSKESKTSIGDTKMQLNQLKSELTSSYPQVYNTLKKVPNTAEGAYLASAIFCINFEIPANTINTAASRGKTCMNGYWKTYSKKSGDVSGRSYTGICGYTYPTAVKKSKGMDAKGYVISNGKIKTVEAKITDSKGKVVFSKKASPGTTAYSLYKMDSALKFSSLDVGRYKYVITAKDCFDKTLSLTHSFEVKSTGSTTYEYGVKTLNNDDKPKESTTSDKDNQNNKADQTTNTEKPKKTYSGTFPKLPKRGYLKKGDKGTQVKRLQKLLRWCGYDYVKVDGKYGSQTAKAVKKLQKKFGYKQTGRFGKKTLKKVKKYKK